MQHSTASTLIVAPREFAEIAVDRFRKTAEIDSLISAKYRDMVERPQSFVPQWKIREAKKIYPNSRVSLGYLFKHIETERPDISTQLMALPDDYRLISQVEIPTAANGRYKNIDIGFTSNGKREDQDESLVDCAIRETLEESRIQLRHEHFASEFQIQRRAEAGINLPLYFSCGRALCFVIVI